PHARVYALAGQLYDFSRANLPHFYGAGVERTDASAISKTGHLRQQRPARSRTDLSAGFAGVLRRSNRIAHPLRQKGGRQERRRAAVCARSAVDRRGTLWRHLVCAPWNAQAYSVFAAILSRDAAQNLERPSKRGLVGKHWRSKFNEYSRVV